MRKGTICSAVSPASWLDSEEQLRMVTAREQFGWSQDSIKAGVLKVAALGARVDRKLSGVLGHRESTSRADCEYFWGAGLGAAREARMAPDIV